MKYKNQSGYTLVELMLVVTIIGILFSLIKPRYDLILQKAWQAKARNNLGSIRTATLVDQPIGQEDLSIGITQHGEFQLVLLHHPPGLRGWIHRNGQ